MREMPLLLVTLILPLFTRGKRPTRFAAAVAGAIVATFLSGLLPILYSNLVHFGHPLGPASFLAHHRADTSLEQVRAHAARTVIVLLEPPFLPEALRGEVFYRPGSQGEEKAIGERLRAWAERRRSADGGAEG